MAPQDGFQQIIDAHKLFAQLRYEHWLQYEAYTAIWWLLLCTWVLPWIVWLYLLKKKQIVEVFCYGITIMFITTLLDGTGVFQGLWEYPIKVIPFTPHLEPIDWGILPVTYMLIYQYFTKWKRFIIAHIIAATIYSFVGEPFLMKNLGLYLQLQWENSYSFPIYLILAILPRGIIKFLYHIERQSQMNGGEKVQ